MSLLPQPFYFVRHGQTQRNLEGVFQGASDVPLNATGIRQAEEARDRIAREPIASICCSPLQRARRTAEIINEHHKLEIVENYDLREAEFGPYEGQPYQFWLQEYLAGDDSNAPDGIEPLEAFVTRTRNAINLALNDLPAPVLIVAHGGVYMPVNAALHPLQRRGLANCETLHHEPDGAGGWTVKNV